MSLDEFKAKYRNELAGRLVHANVVRNTPETIIEWSERCVISSQSLLERMYADLVPSPPTTKGSK